MTKFILIMYLCSGIPGNPCKLVPTPKVNFDSYYECAVFGYDYTATMLKKVNPTVVDQYRMFTTFNCNENSTI